MFLRARKIIVGNGVAVVLAFGVAACNGDGGGDARTAEEAGTPMTGTTAPTSEETGTGATTTADPAPEETGTGTTTPTAAGLDQDELAEIVAINTVGQYVREPCLQQMMERLIRNKSESFRRRAIDLDAFLARRGCARRQPSQETIIEARIKETKTLLIVFDPRRRGDVLIFKQRLFYDRERGAWHWTTEPDRRDLRLLPRRLTAAERGEMKAITTVGRYIAKGCFRNWMNDLLSRDQDGRRAIQSDLNAFLEQHNCLPPGESADVGITVTITETEPLEVKLNPERFTQSLFYNEASDGPLAWR